MVRVLVAGVVATLVLAGCGGEESAGGAGALAVLDAAANKVADTESFRADYVMHSDIEGEEMSFEGEGTFTADSTRGRMQGTMTAPGQGEMTFEGIVADGVMYLKGDQIPTPQGKEWLKTPDPPASTLSPSEFARFLRESESVKNVGTEEIRGEQTTHFRGPLDIRELAEESGDEIIQRLSRSPAVDDLRFMIDIWVGPDDLPWRMIANVSMPAQASGSLTITADILEYDVDVNADEPPADKVAPLNG
jgi:hypothetical protein